MDELSQYLENISKTEVEISSGKLFGMDLIAARHIVSGKDLNIEYYSSHGCLAPF